MDFLFLGEEELAVAFRILGIPSVAVSDERSARDAFAAATGVKVDDSTAAEAVRRTLGGSSPRVLVMSSTALAMVGDAANEWQAGGEFPLLAEIPDLGGWPKGRETLVDGIRKAIGIQI